MIANIVFSFLAGVGAVCLCVILYEFIKAWYLEKKYRKERESRDGDYVTSYEHHVLVANIIFQSAKVGDFTVYCIDARQHADTAHVVTVTHSSNDPIACSELLREINPFEYGLSDEVIVEATRQNGIDGVKLHFAAKNAGAAMLFKLAYGGAA